MLEVCGFYGLTLSVSEGLTLDQWIKDQLDKPPVVGDIVHTPTVSFVVKQMSGDRVLKVGVL